MTDPLKSLGQSAWNDIVWKLCEQTLKRVDECASPWVRQVVHEQTSARETVWIDIRTSIWDFVQDTVKQ